MDTIPPSKLEKMSKAQLINLVERGILGVMITSTQVTDVMAIPREELPEYKKHEQLRGQPISIGKASRKYEIPHPTISRWVKRGYVQRIGMDKNRVLIDEADIAYCAEVHKQRQGPGKWLFNPDGTPYTKK